MSAWIDAHAHPERTDLAEELARLAEANVIGFVAVGTDLASSAELVELVRSVREQAPELAVAAAIGVHPHDAAHDGNEESLARLAALARTNAAIVSAIGECGLDYHYDYSPRDVQRRVFAAQVTLAHELGLTLVVHTREAWADTVAILDDAPSPPAVIIHSFSEGPEEARQALERGWYLSFSGIITFKNAEPVRAALGLAPPERVLVETDTPFLAPVPLRGKPNHIANVAVTGRFVAAKLGLDEETFAALTTSTTRALFALD